MPKGRDISSAFEVRRGEVERMGNSEAQPTKVFGEIQANGTGECAVTVAFPVLFVNKPLFSWGSELGPGQPTVSGSFPACSTSVLQWSEGVRDDGTVIYSGATFGIITSGPDGQVMIVQWHMEGVALTGPV